MKAAIKRNGGQRLRNWRSRYEVWTYSGVAGAVVRVKYSADLIRNVDGLAKTSRKIERLIANIALIERRACHSVKQIDGTRGEETPTRAKICTSSPEDLFEPQTGARSGQCRL